ncbi:MAG: M28 family peptidase, partial [Bacteroidota bacterium]
MTNRLYDLFLTGVLCSISLIASAQELSQSQAYEHVKYLASDELQGRNTGTEGNNQAARYIADVFKNAGLKNAPGREDYFQKFILKKSAPSLGNQLVINGKKLKEKTDMIFLQGGDLDHSGEIVFVKYGYVDEESGRDDYAGRDVEGKIVIAFLGKDEKSDPSESFSLIQKKRQDAAKKGALAFIELYNAPYPWQGITRFFSRPRFSPISPEEDQAGNMVYIWINDKDDVFAGMLDAQTKMEAQVISQEGASESIKTQNVIGMIEGSDAQMKDEFVVLSAHYDHVGTRPNRENNPEADTIFNGARDNAMGTTAVLEAARYFAQNPPKRSMLFVAYTGEEIGLLGSRYFSEQPV